MLYTRFEFQNEINRLNYVQDRCSGKIVKRYFTVSNALIPNRIKYRFYHSDRELMASKLSEYMNFYFKNYLILTGFLELFENKNQEDDYIFQQIETIFYNISIELDSLNSTSDNYKFINKLLDRVSQWTNNDIIYLIEYGTIITDFYFKQYIEKDDEEKDDEEKDDEEKDDEEKDDEEKDDEEKDDEEKDDNNDWNENIDRVIWNIDRVIWDENNNYDDDYEEQFQNISSIETYSDDVLDDEICYNIDNLRM
jgi:hypothetical protein